MGVKSVGWWSVEWCWNGDVLEGGEGHPVAEMQDITRNGDDVTEVVT